MKREDIDHLKWLHDRLKFVYGENENIDFMIKFREIIEELQRPPVVHRNFLIRNIRKIYYRIFPTYHVIETKFVGWAVADKMIHKSAKKPEAEKWVLAKEEDNNDIIGMVYLCRKVRILN